MPEKKDFVKAIFSELETVAELIEKGEMDTIHVMFGTKGVSILVQRLREMVEVQS